MRVIGAREASEDAFPAHGLGDEGIDRLDCGAASLAKLHTALNIA
jgi:hypothetical protein